MKQLILFSLIICLFCGCDKDPIPPLATIITAGNVTDIDGNIYYTVTIGMQTWMAENLKVTHYRNGETIPNIKDATTWTALTTGAYCDYNNSPSNSVTYGKLYNWYAVNDSRNIAPTGWHVPTDAEWTILTNYLDGASVAGGILKETGTTHWTTPNAGATNEAGFSALPGGLRGSDGGAFSTLGRYGNWWSATEFYTSYAWFHSMYYDGSNVGGYYDDKPAGFSVRCVRDSQ